MGAKARFPPGFLGVMVVLPAIRRPADARELDGAGYVLAEDVTLEVHRVPGLERVKVRVRVQV